MEIRTDRLEPDFFYHIYNRGINGTKIFDTEENYLYFLRRLKVFISPVCQFYAFCLMPNHFHFVIRIKSEKEINEFLLENNKKINFKEDGLHSYDAIISKQFANFLSSYSQAFNRFNKFRTGPLLESPFKRIRIENEEYLRKLIVYVHQNPKDFVNRLEDYPFSSFKTLISSDSTFLKREEVMEIFGDIENFIFCHQKEEFLD